MNKQHILMIEDDPVTGQSGVDYARLPDGSGCDFCRQMRLCVKVLSPVFSILAVKFLHPVHPSGRAKNKKTCTRIGRISQTDTEKSFLLSF